MSQKPSAAFVGASWVALIAGFVCYNVGLWNAEMLLNEKGYYFTVLMYGLFSAVSLQKSVRDQLEGIPVTNIYYGLSWFSTILAILLLVVGLWNANLTLSEKRLLWHVVPIESFCCDRSSEKHPRCQEGRRECLINIR